MSPKKTKPMFVAEDPPKHMSKEEAERELAKFFERIEQEHQNTPKEVIEFGAKRVTDFIKGDVTWAEMFNIPKKMIRDMVEYGYLQFQTGRYEEAERFFKMLTIMDWKNSYYHSMMGSILQRQKRYADAIAEYSEAVKLNPNDIVSLVNRGEIYMQHKVFDEAIADFERASKLDPKKENKWANRGLILMAQIAQIKKLAASAAEKKTAKNTEQNTKAKKEDKKEKGKKR